MLKPEHLITLHSFHGPECPQQESDIAFLIDGSGSIKTDDFQRMKEFVSTVMNQFTKSNTLVRANGEVREQPMQGCKDIATGHRFPLLPQLQTLTNGQSVVVFFHESPSCSIWVKPQYSPTLCKAGSSDCWIGVGMGDETPCRLCLSSSTES